MLLRGSRERDARDGQPPREATCPRWPRSPTSCRRSRTVTGAHRAAPRLRRFRREDLTGESEGDSSTVRRITAFKLLGGVAEKALAMGRADEAERLLAGPLADVVEATRGGKPVSPWLVDVAARLAAKLATATTKGAWADYVIEIYHAQGRPCAAPVVDELNSAFRKVNAIDLVRLRAYLADLREKQATFGPAERFLLQRIEGLERLAALR